MALWFEQESEPLRAVVVAVQVQGVEDGAFEASVAELHRLARTLRLNVDAVIFEVRARPAVLERLSAAA